MQSNVNPLAPEKKGGATKQNVFPPFLRRSLIAAIPVGFVSFFVVAIYLLSKHPDYFPQYLLRLPSLILYLSAALLVVFGKKLAKKISESRMVGEKAVGKETILYCLLTTLLISLGWLIASSLTRIYALLGN